MRFIAALLCSLLSSIACAQTPLTTADAPSHPIVQPQGSCSLGHFLPWLDQNWCIQANEWSMISVDPSAIGFITVGGTVGVGHVVTLNVTFGGNTYPSSYTTVAGDTLTSVATGLIAAVQANASLYTPGGGLPGQILFLTNSFDGGFTFAPVIAFDFDSRVVMTLSWSSTGAETLSFDPACGTTGCSKTWDNHPSISCGRLPGGIAPPPGSVICNWMVVGAQSANPNALTVQYLNFGLEVRNSTTGQIASRAFWVLPDVNGSLNKGFYVDAGNLYPVSDNTMGAGHSAYRWNTVWGYVGDFATGLTVASKPGLSKTITVAKSMLTTCTMTFTGGLFTGGTC